MNKIIILFLLAAITMTACRTHLNLCEEVLSRKAVMSCDKMLGNDITMAHGKDGAHFTLSQIGKVQLASSQLIDMYWGGTTNKVEITIFGETIETTVVLTTNAEGISSYHRPGDMGPKVNDQEISRFNETIMYVMKRLDKSPCEGHWHIATMTNPAEC